VVRPFRFLKELCDAIVVEPRSQAERKRGHLKRLACFRLIGSSESKPQQAVDGRLEGVAGALYLLLHEARNVIFDREGGAHIKMLVDDAS